MLALGAGLGAGAGASVVAVALGGKETDEDPCAVTATATVERPAGDDGDMISGCPVETTTTEDGSDDAKAETETGDATGDPPDTQDEPSAPDGEGDDTSTPDDGTAPPTDDTTPPTDDTAPPTDDTTPPGDTTPPTDDAVPPGDDTVPPGDDTVPPGDDTVPPGDDTVPPGDETGQVGEPAPTPPASEGAMTVPEDGVPTGPDEPAVTLPGTAPAPAAVEVEPQPGSAAPRPRLPRKQQDPTPETPAKAPRDLPGPPRMTPPPSFITIDPAAFGPLLAPTLEAGAATEIPFPAWLLPVYQAAGVQYQVPWPVLAAINEVETDYGRNAGVSSAGAIGWMQFLPSTWAMYGTDGNGDGVADPAHPVDAIFAAARYLRAAGAKRDLSRAVFAYNHADWYVRKVLARAGAIGALRDDVLATLTQYGIDHSRRRLVAKGAKIDRIGRAMLLSDGRLRRFVLNDERIEIYSCGREDVVNGIVDRRVLLALEHLAFAKLRPTVSSLRCGHGVFTKSGNVSEHTTGTAVDVAALGGAPVLGNQGEGSVTDRAIRRVLRLQGALVPHQVISLMRYEGHLQTLAMADHNDHVHLGFKPLRPLAEDTDDGQETRG